MNLVHIGLPKTGTTTLQNTLFIRQERYTYLGKFNNAALDASVRELIQRISYQDSIDYNSVDTKECLHAAVVKLGKSPRPLLLSDEIFTVEGHADRRVVAGRLHALFAPAKILITLRSQPSLLQSMYLNDLRATQRGIIEFEEWLDLNYHIAFADDYRVALNYDSLISVYEQIFGADNVIVLLFEHLKNSCSKFMEPLGELMGMSSEAVRKELEVNVDNARLSQRHLAIKHLEGWLPKGTNLATMGRYFLPDVFYQPMREFFVGGKRVKTPPVPADWLERISAQCAESNKRLAERRILPLNELGYPMPHR